MKPEAQRIAIAEACGWHNVQPNPIRGILPLAGTTKHGAVSDATNPLFGIPDHLNSLDAMHEAESLLIVGYHDMEYRETLEPLCGQYAVIYHATAAQRAEAFLRTLNLWTDEP